MNKNKLKKLEKELKKLKIETPSPIMYWLKTKTDEELREYIEILGMKEKEKGGTHNTQINIFRDYTNEQLYKIIEEETDYYETGEYETERNEFDM